MIDHQRRHLSDVCCGVINCDDARKKLITNDVSGIIVSSITQSKKGGVQKEKGAPPPGGKQNGRRLSTTSDFSFARHGEPRRGQPKTKRETTKRHPHDSVLFFRPPV